jgi:hypothetical protein
VRLERDRIHKLGSRGVGTSRSCACGPSRVRPAADRLLLGRRTALGFSISSWSKSYARSGFYTLRHVRGKDSCDVTASVAGSRLVIVQIYKKR